MNTDDFLQKLKNNCNDYLDYNISTSCLLQRGHPIRELIEILTETPEYSFALREDVKDDLRFLPTKAVNDPSATGWDVRACFEDKKSITIKPFEYIKIPLGFRGFCPEGYWYELRPRSSTHAKKHLNSLYGVIDETYQNYLVFSCQYIPPFVLNEDNYELSSLTIEHGEAIGQIIPINRQEMKVKQISNQEYDQKCKNRNGSRGEGGFGSSDKQK